MEPNTDHHDSLRKKIKQEGLSDVYVIVPVGVEDLGSTWFKEGEVDSIITVRALFLFVYLLSNYTLLHRSFSLLWSLFVLNLALTLRQIRCLCSVDNPKAMITSLYKYLKPGGQWIVYEHVITNVGGLVALYQCEHAPPANLNCANREIGTLDFIWPYFLGGCSITRDSEKWLREAGTWSAFDLRQPADEPSYKVLPHVSGVLIK